MKERPHKRPLERHEYEQVSALIVDGRVDHGVGIALLPVGGRPSKHCL